MRCFHKAGLGSCDAVSNALPTFTVQKLINFLSSSQHADSVGHICSAQKGAYHGA